ncbi:MAG: flagellar basal body rod protein FlgB [Vulcanimicrobiaceae bacterium]|jgi:flagellar basal-body rod protein FlgB
MAGVDPLSFGTTVNVLKDAMKGVGMEQTQLANNIANVNTPNFQRGTVKFKEALAASLGTPPTPGELGLKVNNSRQFAIGDPAPKAFDPKAQTVTGTQMRVDGSNVDIDQEAARLAQNAGYGQTMAQLLYAQYMRLRIAITEQP